VNTGRTRATAHGAGGFSAGVSVTLTLSLLAAAGVLWVYTGMIAHERWPIRWLEVDGPFERVSAEQVRIRLAPMVKGSFFTVNPGRMCEVAGEMPWVSGVTVQKGWPDTVHVTIQEYTAVAHWINGYLVAANGKPFHVPAANEIQGLPWLDSPEAQLDVVFANWKKFDDTLVLIGQQLERLTLDRRGSWSAVLSGGTEVRFGKGDIFKNLGTLVSAWAGLMQGRVMPPVRIDLRYTNGFAVMWPQNVEKIVGNYGEKS